MEKNYKTGLLYLIRSHQYIKIGYTDDWSKREGAYRTHNPEFELLDLVKGDMEDEGELHQKIGNKKGSTEWTPLDPKVADVWLKYKEETDQLEHPEYYHDINADGHLDDKWLKIPRSLMNCNCEFIYKYVRFIDREVDLDGMYWKYKADEMSLEMIHGYANHYLNFVKEDRFIPKGTRVRIRELYKYEPLDYILVNHKVLDWPVTHEAFGAIFRVYFDIQDNRVDYLDWKDIAIKYFRPYGIDMLLHLYRKKILKIDNKIYLKPFKNIKYGNDTKGTIN